jgi:hypothetical protein
MQSFSSNFDRQDGRASRTSGGGDRDGVSIIDVNTASGTLSRSGPRISSVVSSDRAVERHRSRRLHPVWEMVDIVELDVICKACNKVIRSPGRGHHVERVRRLFERWCIKRAKDTKITDTFHRAVSVETTRAFKEKFALWVYSTGMAFYEVEHCSLAEALRVLNVGVVVPTRNELSNGLLDSYFDSSISALTSALVDEPCTVVTDAWTDVNGFSVVNYVALAGEKTYFWSLRTLVPSCMMPSFLGAAWSACSPSTSFYTQLLLSLTTLQQTS